MPAHPTQSPRTPARPNTLAHRCRPGLALGLALLLAGCASVGPDFQPPQAAAPADWASRPSAAPALSGTLLPTDDALSGPWWQVFGDATLDALQARAAQTAPDLQTASLRFAQSRLQRRMLASQAAPQVDINAQATRQRQSEHSAETRLVTAIGGAGAPQMVDVLSEPFALYQAGFDLSWELDLWGRVRRSVEAADADIAAAGAQWQDVQLVLSGELARAYFELRGLQHREALLARSEAIAHELLELQQTLADQGLSDQGAALAQTENLASLRAQQSELQAQQAALLNQIGVLTGEPPGALNALLAPAATDIDGDEATELPALALGQPADLLRRRPDVRAAEARLHVSTAQIGVAVADLYPRIALGASAGIQSMAADSFAEWGSRTWRVGPMLSLPVFDQGRRRANVELQRREQQIAAIAWRQSVLKAWQELDDALNDHAAERQRQQRLREREAASGEQMAFARARNAAGLTSELAPLQAELAWRQVQAERAASDTRLRVTLVHAYKAAGGGMAAPAPAVADAVPPT